MCTNMFMYTRDLSVNRLLMRHAVLKNKITAFVCVGEIITNVLAGPWMADNPGGRNISGYQYINLYSCTPPHASLDISYLLVK